jgi:hypothetical protein
MQAPPTVPCPAGYEGWLGEPSGNACGSRYVPLRVQNIACQLSLDLTLVAIKDLMQHATG